MPGVILAALQLESLLNNRHLLNLITSHLFLQFFCIVYLVFEFPDLVLQNLPNLLFFSKPFGIVADFFCEKDGGYLRPSIVNLWVNGRGGHCRGVQIHVLVEAF